ncbi:Competence protein CoiA-like family, contains a predicted nuclease domain [Terribacillus halophilus]|uniref:Competence protein CoiA-like family, contains a predicted nuclease domain n=1 Tax=Terribacillus halophilus TaxID=361279 RepID=A0A1G6PFY1_9BACI|nr:competence protein CoiA family protein [Terribacillus halophilus]SDC79162.1 Competence protein CoiA-like family, contains a predicted nuclease domain [Terribacillus halophilus]
MLQAELEDGRLVLLAAYRTEQIHKLRKHRFLCPACKKAVIIRAGKKVIPHFAHEQIHDCELNRTGESLYHMRGKLQLFHWFKRQGLTVRLEERIEKSTRRPDLLLHTAGGKRLAIEYQCASISDEELFRRNEAYEHDGIRPIWILGGNRLKRTSTFMLDLSKRDQRFLMQYKRDMPLQLLYYCSDSEAFCNVQHILLTGKKQTVGQFYFLPLQQIQFPELFHPLPKNHQKIKQTWIDFQSRMAAKPLTYAPGNMKRWVLQLYERGLTLQEIPVTILYPVEAQYHMSVPPYIWQTDLWLEQLIPLPVMNSISLERLKHVSKRWEVLHKPYAISSDIHPVESYMNHLCLHGWFEQMGTDVYVKKRRSPFSEMI